MAWECGSIRGGDRETGGPMPLPPLKLTKVPLICMGRYGNIPTKKFGQVCEHITQHGRYGKGMAWAIPSKKHRKVWAHQRWNKRGRRGGGKLDIGRAAHWKPARPPGTMLMTRPEGRKRRAHPVPPEQVSNVQNLMYPISQIWFLVINPKDDHGITCERILASAIMYSILLFGYLCCQWETSLNLERITKILRI